MIVIASSRVVFGRKSHRCASLKENTRRLLHPRTGRCCHLHFPRSCPLFAFLSRALLQCESQQHTGADFICWAEGAWKSCLLAIIALGMRSACRISDWKEMRAYAVSGKRVARDCTSLSLHSLQCQNISLCVWKCALSDLWHDCITPAPGPIFKTNNNQPQRPPSLLKNCSASQTRAFYYFTPHSLPAQFFFVKTPKPTTENSNEKSPAYEVASLFCLIWAF